ncbi:hypothetical protein DAEQUDRAFT_783988 [Daedalea quercina L-15889]|uniref:Uncharacterized protein n=1 Tax=Daedalea quercina L-15889 TaxID=1314783 RepID=A0A165KGS3_9APHY|nr:hypothetical protein DAEQUDRAFT_783988 [Daedalea quercina L-15889]
MPTAPQHNGTLEPSAVVEEYSTGFASMRGQLRAKIAQGLDEITEGSELKPKMAWTPGAYFAIVKQHRVRLRGWPKAFPFGNFSDLPHSTNIVRELHRLWDRKELAWEHVPDGEELSLESSLPSWTLKGPSTGRRDIGGTHRRPVKRARYPRTGAKTPVIVDSSLDSDIEDFTDEEDRRAQKRRRCEPKSAEYVESDAETEREEDSRVATAEVDEIEDFSD